MTCAGVTDLGAEAALDALFLIDLILGAHKVNGLRRTFRGAVVTAHALISVDNKHGINSFLSTKVDNLSHLS